MLPILLAAAALPSIVGIQLGAPITLPECVHQPGAMSEYYEHSQSSECVQYDAAPAGATTGMIYFPPLAMPAIAGFNYASAWFIDGRVELLGLNTLDHNHADYIVAQLTAKFGKPTTDEPDTVELYHISLPERKVVWARPGFTVEYNSIKHNLDHGHVLIMTDAAAARDERQRKAQKSQETPL